MPRGAGALTPTPHHSGTDDPEGGPLWLQLQGYVQPMTLCQDHSRVLTTGALVPLANRVSPAGQTARCHGSSADGSARGRVTSALSLLDYSPAEAGSIAVAGPCLAGSEGRCR